MALFQFQTGLRFELRTMTCSAKMSTGAVHVPRWSPSVVGSKKHSASDGETFLVRNRQDIASWRSSGRTVHPTDFVVEINDWLLVGRNHLLADSTDGLFEYRVSRQVHFAETLSVSVSSRAKTAQIAPAEFSPDGRDICGVPDNVAGQGSGRCGIDATMRIRNGDNGIQKKGCLPGRLTFRRVNVGKKMLGRPPAVKISVRPVRTTVLEGLIVS